MDVGAGLGVTPLIEVGDGVVVRVGDIILSPVMLENAMRVIVTFWGIFYLHNTCK